MVGLRNKMIRFILLIIGLISLVYSKKLSQLPQADTSAGHNPNLSATADKKPIPIANLKKSLMIFVFILYCFPRLLPFYSW
jgi:hypothetical protein